MGNSAADWTRTLASEPAPSRSWAARSSDVSQSPETKSAWARWARNDRVQLRSPILRASSSPSRSIRAADDVQHLVEEPEVEERPQLGADDVPLAGDRQRALDQHPAFAQAVLEQQVQRPLGVQRLGHDVGQVERGRDPQRVVERLHDVLGSVAHEAADASELGGQRAQARRRLAAAQHRIGLLHLDDRLLRLAEQPARFGKFDLRQRGALGIAPRLAEPERLGVQLGGPLQPVVLGRVAAGKLEHAGALVRLVRQLQPPFREPKSFPRRAQGRGPCGRPFQGRGGTVADLRRVRVAGQEPVRVKPVRRHHLGQLGAVSQLGDELGGGQVHRLAVAAGERLVGDRSCDRLHEAELPEVGRERIAVAVDQLLAGQRCERPVDLVGVQAADRRQTLGGERLAQHGRLLQRPPLPRGQRVKPRRHQGMQRLRDLQLADVAGGADDAVVVFEQAPVEQHAHRLDGVQRDPLRLQDDAADRVGGDPRRHALDDRPHVLLAQRFQRHRRVRAQAGSPGGS